MKNYTYKNYYVRIAIWASPWNWVGKVITRANCIRVGFNYEKSESHTNVLLRVRKSIPLNKFNSHFHPICTWKYFCNNERWISPQTRIQPIKQSNQFDIDPEKWKGKRRTFTEIHTNPTKIEIFTYHCLIGFHKSAKAQLYKKKSI